MLVARLARRKNVVMCVYVSSSYDDLRLAVDSGEANGSDDRVGPDVRCRVSKSGDQCPNGRITAVMSTRSAAASQQTTKRETEVPGAECVDERVDGGVAVAEPEEDDEDDWRRAVAAEHAQHVDGEERCPAQDEAADDHAQSLGGLLLAVQPPQLGPDLDEATPGVRLRRGDELDVAVTRAAGALLEHRRQQSRLHQTFHTSFRLRRCCSHRLAAASTRKSGSPTSPARCGADVCFRRQGTSAPTSHVRRTCPLTLAVVL